MANRRLSRELALQSLFYFDRDKEIKDSEKLVESFKKNFGDKIKLSDESFFTKLVHGVIKSKPEIDLILQTCSKNWKISRMPGVDRVIMRIAIFELLHCSDIPSVVSINEAVEIAKKFGTAKSAGFINGVLDCIRVEQKL